MDWKTYQKERQQQRAENRQEAADEFQEAAELANEHNLTLTRCTDAHYHLRAFEDGVVCWLYNLYPGNQRIWSDRKYRGPFLRSVTPWTLKDVVEAVIARQKERRN